jgi:hypothetical protein
VFVQVIEQWNIDLGRAAACSFRVLCSHCKRPVQKNLDKLPEEMRIAEMEKTISANKESHG